MGMRMTFFVAVVKHSKTEEWRVPLGSAAVSSRGKQRWRGRSTEIRAVPDGGERSRRAVLPESCG